MRYKTKLFKATNNATSGRRAHVTANEPYRKQYVNSLTTDTQTTRRNEKINVLTHENVTNGNKTWRIIICLHWPSDKSFWLGHNIPTKRHRQNTPFSQTVADDI